LGGNFRLPANQANSAWAQIQLVIHLKTTTWVYFQLF
jgi:hypothetical protein